MTIKTITNTTLNSGYVLSNSYSALSITSTGTIHGAVPNGVGLTVSFAAHTYNFGLITGGAVAAASDGRPCQWLRGGRRGPFRGRDFFQCGRGRRAPPGARATTRRSRAVATTAPWEAPAATGST